MGQEANSTGADSMAAGMIFLLLLVVVPTVLAGWRSDGASRNIAPLAQTSLAVSRGSSATSAVPGIVALTGIAITSSPR